MTKEIFKAMLASIKESRDKSNAVYKLNIDLLTYEESYHKTINLLMRCYFGTEGYDWIDWFLYEKDGREDMTAHDKDGKEICRNIDELYELVEECRKNNTEEYVIPTPLTDEEKQFKLDLIRFMRVSDKMGKSVENLYDEFCD